MAKEKNKTELPQVLEGELQARLIKLREDAGFDVSQMANALCLSEEVITNLENEDFELLAEPPYVRGYLRNYAKLGDEDPSELITRYEALRGADADELDFQIKSTSTITSKPKKRLSPVWAQVILLGILLGAIGLISTIPGVNTWITEKWQSFSSQLKPSSVENNPSLLGELPVPAPLPEDELSNSTNTTTADTTNSNNSSASSQAATNNQAENSQPTATESTLANNSSSTDSTTNVEDTITPETAPDNTATTESATETTTNQTEVSTEEIAVTNTAEEIAPTSSDEFINIKLVFDKEVWLRIKDKENKTVFEGLNKAATEKSIELKKPLTFRVGNAQGLSLFIDDKAVDISTYINGSIANFTLE